VVPAKLIVGAAVGRAQEEALKSRCVRLDSKCDADEAASEFWRVCPWKARNCRFDHPVLKFRVTDNGEGLVVGGILVRLNKPDSPAAAIGEKICADMMQLELVQG
jgi:hypothetical protein